MRATWLADVLRDAGCDVWEQPGWRGRGKELSRIAGVVWHHTASSPKTSDTAMAAILREGRPDLPGPLAQLGLERDGTFIVVADGRANHNGYGTWGNESIGIEAYNDGVGEPWPRVQIDAFQLGTAAILRHLGLDANAVKGHKETDPHRKIDPAGLDMFVQRTAITALLSPRPPAPPITPSPIPVPLLEDQDMPYLLRAKASPTDGLWLIDGNKAVNIATEASFEYARKQSPTVPVVTLDAPTARLFLTTKTAVMDRR